MNADNKEALEEAWEPFEIVQLLGSKAMTDPSRKAAASKNFMADLLGEEGIPPPPSDQPRYVVDFTYSLLELYGSFHRFDTYGTMIAYYPWRGRIGRRDHLATSVYMLLHEAYIFEERLKRFFRAIDVLANKLEVQDYDRSHHARIIKGYHRAFSSLLKARGLHVHQNDFNPKELSWIGTLELLARHPETDVWKGMLPTAMTQARRRWLDVHRDVKNASTGFLRVSVRQTKPVWLALKHALSDPNHEPNSVRA